MADQFFKIRHIPSGLFFKPSKDTRDINLSKKGKVYQRKPSAKAYSSLKVRLGFGEVGSTAKDGKNDILVDFDIKDWQVIKYTTYETKDEW